MEKLLEPPFFMFAETEMEKYRFRSFWTKEPETLLWIQSFDPHDVFYDVGANIGIYSLYAAHLYPEMKIFAFEPVEANHRQMIRNKKFNEFGNLFNAVNCAIGDYVGECRLDVYDVELGSSGAQTRRPTKPVSGATAYTQVMRMETIDHLCEIWPKPDHVKIDIDGQELAVLEGMKLTISYIKSILIEVSSETKWSVLDLLIREGFSVGNRFNSANPHSRTRRADEKIDAENIVFIRC